MSEHAVPGVSTKVDLGVAEILKVPLEYIKHFSKKWLEDEKRRAQSASLQQAIDNADVLRFASSYLQRLRFERTGLSFRIDQYRQRPNRKNARLLRDALMQVERNANERKREFESKWNDETTRRHVRAEYAKLTEVINEIYKFKAIALWEQRLEPQNLKERLPFFRKPRLTRIAQSYFELQEKFDELNEGLDVALPAISDVISAYQSRIDELAQTERSGH